MGYEDKEKKRESDRKYYLKNKEKIREAHRLWKENNKEYLKEMDKVYSKRYRLKNKEEINRKSREKQPITTEKRRDYKKEYNKKYFQKNKKIIQEYHRVYRIERYHSDDMFRCSCAIRSMIWTSLRNKGYTKKSRTYEILGISYEEFSLYMERQFVDGMCWGNHGEWHIDHIIPLSSAHTEADVIKLNHYTNLQPLWAYDNLSKGSKIL